MAELSIPYTKRQLARRATGGGGVNVPSQPRIPDVSSLYGAMGQVGQELSQSGEMLARVAQAQQRARDTATLTALEASVDEQVAGKAQEILRDASIHPFDYRPLLTSYRDSLIESADLPERLKPLAKAKVQASTSRFLISIDAEGTKRGIDQALQALDLRSDQLIRRQVGEPDAAQRGVLDTQIRELYASYVDSGILTPADATTRLQKARDASAVYQVQQAIRLNPDLAVAQLEKGLEANTGIPPADYGKLVDEARRVQRERFNFEEAQEAKLERDTQRVQKDQEAVAFGQVQAGKLGRAALDRLRDSRQISGSGYETLVRYLDTKQREDRSEARAKASLGLQYEERRNRETEAQLSILATTGELDEKGIIDFAASKKLPARAIDGAIAKAQARQNAQQSEWRAQQGQAEQMLSKAFTKGPFEILEPVTAEAYASALDELTRRSKAFGGQEDPLTIVRDLIPKYQASLSADRDTQSQGLRDRLQYATPDMLEADRLNIPPTLYQDQRKLFKKIEELERQNMTPTEDLGRRKKGETGPSFWERWLGGK